MQKKLLAVAVAGVLAAPAVALAQSSVTISGIFKSSLENVKIGNPGAVRNGLGINSSGTRLADDSSRIIFNVTEDLGGGLAAIGQLDVRFRYDESGAGTPTNVGGAIGSGNSFVGLRAKSWGEVVFGRRDLHYFNTESLITTKAASLRMDSISVISYIDGIAIAGGTRSQNVVRWLSPNWGGFTMIAAYSTNAPGNDNDMLSTVRKGDAFNFQPNFEAANWQIGYSYWKQTADGSTAPGSTAQNQRGDRLYGSFKWSGLKVGLAWDQSQVKNVSAATTFEFAKRTSWSLPVSFTTGNHNFYGHYTRADDDKTNFDPTAAAAVRNRSSIQVPSAGGGFVCGTAVLGACGTGANMWALAYVYDLSKRTSLGVSYSKISNDSGASYNHFTSTSLGGPDSAVAAGEDPKIFAATIRHAF